MKNYKINSIPDINSIFNSKCFTSKQDEKLKEMGFRYETLFKSYRKTYVYNPPYGNVEMVLFVGDEYLRFYSSDYFLPCELEQKTSPYYKVIMKNLREDMKILKEIGIINK